MYQPTKSGGVVALNPGQEFFEGMLEGMFGPVQPPLKKENQTVVDVTDFHMSSGPIYTGKLIRKANGLWYPDGWGKFVYPNNDVYEGNVANCELEGRGKYTAPNGMVNDGEWEHGEFVSGTSIWDDGTKYVGTWYRNGAKNGGKIFWRDGREYNGDWKLMPYGKKELPDGHGALVLPDGSNYVGDFKDGKKHGFGKLTQGDKTIKEGIWREDEFVAEPRSSRSAESINTNNTSIHGIVAVAGDDPTFEVFADGTFVGNIPAKLELAEGMHVIEVRKNGFKDYKREIKVLQGCELNVRAVLEKE